MTIIAAADGSALGNPGPAGWAWFIDDTSWRAGGWAHGTNNMGELTAVLNLLESTRHCAHEPLRILCDSQYVINSVTKWLPGWKKKGWKKKDGKPVLNVEIMKALDRELAGRPVEFEWVKGHAGHELNEAADERARAMATAFQEKRPPEQLPVGPGFRDQGPTDRPSTHSEDAQGAAPAPSGTETARHADPATDEPDLFSELLALDQQRQDQQEPEAAPVDSVQQVMARENSLWRTATPHSRALLHEQFDYVSADGALHAAEQFVTDIARGGSTVAPDMDAGSVVRLGPTAYHVSYRMSDESGTTRRSSLWLRQDHHNEMGPWLLRHHQVTAES